MIIIVTDQQLDVKFSDLLPWIMNEENQDQRRNGKNDFLQSGKYEKTRLQAVGISNGQLKKCARSFYNANKNLDLTDLLPKIDEVMKSSDMYEYQLLVIYILERYKKQVEKLDTQVFDLVNNWIDEIDYWAISDHLAINLFPYLPLEDAKYQKEIASWITSDNYWRRRQALTAYLKHCRNDPAFFEIVVETAEQLIDDENYYIKKAIPWIIREAYRKHERHHDAVISFLEENMEHFNKTMLRETIRYLDDEQQQDLLDQYDNQ